MKQCSTDGAGTRRQRLPVGLTAAGVGATAVALLLLVGILITQGPFALDRHLLLGLRTPDKLAVPIGPDGLLSFMRDVTALGDGTVLTLAVVVTAGLLLMRGQWLTAMLAVAATLSGSLLITWAKPYIGRARPELVPHLVEVRNLSFPSGHASNSAMVYITLTALAMQAVPERAARNYLMICATILVGLIGASRVYLGVHWPSDVLAGWSFGTLWALGWWMLGSDMQTRRGNAGMG